MTLFEVNLLEAIRDINISLKEISLIAAQTAKSLEEMLITLQKVSSEKENSRNSKGR